MSNISNTNRRISLYASRNINNNLNPGNNPNPNPNPIYILVRLNIVMVG